MLFFKLKMFVYTTKLGKNKNFCKIKGFIWPLESEIFNSSHCAAGVDRILKGGGVQLLFFQIMSTFKSPPSPTDFLKQSS